MAWWAVLTVVLASTTPPTTPPPASVPAAPATSVPAAPATSVPAVPTTVAPGSTDPLGCAALVYDPADELDDEQVAAGVQEVAAPLGADLHVRAERDLDGGLDARMGQLESQCPGWSTGIDRAPNLVVVMYSSTEREASVFYGAAVSYSLRFRWEHAVDEMGELFRSGDYTGGVLAGLHALQQDPPIEYEPTYTPTAYEREEPNNAVPAIMWLFVIALVGIAIARVAQYLKTGEWASGDDDDGGSSWWTSSSGSSGWHSSSSSSHSWSSGSSRSSGSRSSSGSSGGGTKKW